LLQTLTLSLLISRILMPSAKTKLIVSNLLCKFGSRE